MGYNFQTTRKITTKLHTTFFQDVFNHFVNFRSKWTINVELTAALKLGVQKSNIGDIGFCTIFGRALHALCMVYCWNKEVPGLSVVPICHHYHLRYNLNRCIAQLSCCSDSDVQQIWLAQKDLLVVVLITMALIATQDFLRVSSKRIGEIVNLCIDDLEIKAHMQMVDMFMHFLRESEFEACM